ncbi:MAG: CHAT domain-containing protein, partial [Planctomycetes bacterium]|nr:CHAT domain-containing protein [Planctomycetota bacterium]
RELADAVLTSEMKHRLRFNHTFSLIVEDSTSSIPFEMAYTDDRFVGLTYPISRKWNSSRPPLKKGRIQRGVILGDPQFNLLHALYEAMDVRRLWEQSSRFDKIEVLTSHITRNQALEAIENADWLHMCGHAVSWGSQRGWMFRDGMLLPSDLIRTLRRHGPQFVFAHACGSAERSNDSQETLKDAFRSQGCEHFIGTTVPIPDQRTMPFVVNVYRSLFAGKTIGEAVLDGRRSLATVDGSPSLLWACYSLFGDPTIRLIEQGESSSKLNITPAVVQHTTLTEPHRPRWTCHVCGRGIETEHGIGRIEESVNPHQYVCRRCSRELKKSTAVACGVNPVDPPRKSFETDSGCSLRFNPAVEERGVIQIPASLVHLHPSPTLPIGGRENLSQCEEV